MIVSFVHPIGWWIAIAPILQKSLAPLSEASRERVICVVAKHDDMQLSFLYSDENRSPTQHWACFLPERGFHPRACDYDALLAKAATMDAAIAKAEEKLLTLLSEHWEAHQVWAPS